ncbi:hypothetical protein HS088_TW17G01088 [Tripterygium wilfordii]|uniref:Uncharacterized protein n=1 Tax=Tripterygium wilfordii TaxID=458696 RepID=A0A7J7CHK7_TRIWF|nr:uncharacterized protein LOC119982324 [Tripterygium wilfordii]KAF5733542.1 hypothetical protein HS088_TW17G01088 [Tripterygium wilfordii]
MEDPELEWEIEEHESEENSGKRCWGIVDNGLSLGKKILVTGVLLSSAPLVLPPLLVISTIGFVFSVPSGLLLANYVCAEKLLGKLLPRTTPPPLLLGFGIWSNNEDVDGANVEQDIDYEEEEEELLTDIKGDVEGKFEINEKENGKVDYTKGLVGPYEKELSESADEIVEENGYGRDVVKCLDEQDKPLEEIEVTIRRRGEGLRDELVAEQVKDEQPVNVLFGVEVVIKGDERSESNVVEEETPFEVIKVAVDSCLGGDIEEVKELVRETGALLEKLRDEGDTVDVESIDVANIVEEEQRPWVEKWTVLRAEKADESTANNDILVKDKKKNLQSSKEEVREITDESEFGLLHDKNAAAQPSKKEAYNSTEGRVATDSAELPYAEREVETNHGGKSSKKNISMGSKVPYSEEEIWKQIYALRSIVGYQVLPQATYNEEIKALYVFTGVEPPASLEEHSDLKGVNDKLQFLKSIVGVK